MKQTIQKTLGGDAIKKQEQQASLSPVSMKDIIWLPVLYVISTFNLQRVMYLFSFATYGIADGVTAAYLMAKKGITSEVNPIARFMYASAGLKGVLLVKIWFASVILFIVWVISRRDESYWMINGFLLALATGGIMATRANLMAASGINPPSPGSVIMTFLFLTVILVMIGDIMDKLINSRPIKYGTSA